jgi:hypothetical protein
LSVSCPHPFSKPDGSYLRDIRPEQKVHTFISSLLESFNSTEKMYWAFASEVLLKISSV